MPTRAMNVKLEEDRILEIKNVAFVFHMTMTDVVNEALDEYLSKMKKDPFYRLTAKVEEASAEETEEILEQLGNMSDDDLTISTAKRFVV